MSTPVPNRKSYRLPGYDYRAEASYFLTICTHEQRHLFGKVIGNAMLLSDFGVIAAEEWQISIKLRRELVSHAFVVMPNHVHVLISIVPESAKLRFEPRQAEQRLRSRSVGALVNGYKGAVTTTIKTRTNSRHFTVWQGNYHDHVVRNDQDFANILAYIQDNPARWAEDRFNK